MFADENVKKLSNFKKTGTERGVVIEQDTKFAANIKKNILPKIQMPPGFKIELFALAPDARHMAVSRNKGTVWIGTRKTKVWQATDRDMDNVADTVEEEELQWKRIITLYFYYTSNTVFNLAQ